MSYEDFYPYTKLDSVDLLVSELSDLLLCEHGATLVKDPKDRPGHLFAYPEPWEGFSHLHVRFEPYDEHWRMTISAWGYETYLRVATSAELDYLLLRHVPYPPILKAMQDIHDFCERRPYAFVDPNVPDFRPFELTPYQVRALKVIKSRLTGMLRVYPSGPYDFKIYVQNYRPKLLHEPGGTPPYYISVRGSQVKLVALSNGNPWTRTVLTSWLNDHEEVLRKELQAL